MGTQLEDNNGMIWPSLSGLAKSGLDRLINNNDALRSADLIPELYAPMVNRLQQQYRVESAGYDWRKGIDEIADVLRLRIEACLAEKAFEKQAIHFIAHGAGALGLLRLAMNQAFWDQIAARNGRIVLLGVPIRGCAAFDFLKEAKAPLNRLLRMADHQSASTPEKVFSQFRSIQDLQPESVRKLALPDPARVRNLFAITGKAERTVSRVLGDGTVLYTSAGDGLVTLEASHMEGVPTWQVDAPHGMLGCNELLTESLLDLLSRGAAPKLKRVIGPALTVDVCQHPLTGPCFFQAKTICSTSPCAASHHLSSI
jgi:hypothetical protein